MKSLSQMVFGIEFESIGLYEQYSILAKKGRIFERNIHNFIDVNKVLSKLFLAFLTRIQEDNKKIKIIKISDYLIIISVKVVALHNLIFKQKK